jgi:hypothetical protein
MSSSSVRFLLLLACSIGSRPVVSFVAGWGSSSSRSALLLPVAPDDNEPASSLENRGPKQSKYNLGVGKNLPLRNNDDEDDAVAPKPAARTTRRMIARDQSSQTLRGALWDETHYTSSSSEVEHAPRRRADLTQFWSAELTQSSGNAPPPPRLQYPDIDLSIPSSVFQEDGSVDHVWDLLRYEAYQETLREPLLVSFLHSSILNHPSLESSLAFLLANRLQSPAMMISTQLQSLILEALHKSPEFRRALRADIMAVRDRDPACNALPDVFLFFKGFHALQAYRVANYLWSVGKHVLAQYLQSQVSQVFQIDIHVSYLSNHPLLAAPSPIILTISSPNLLRSRMPHWVVGLCLTTVRESSWARRPSWGTIVPFSIT